MRQLYRRIGQCAYYKYKDKVYLVTHAGLSNVPDNLTTVSTVQMIRGVGNYNDFEAVANAFVDNTPDTYYQIHGHRNTKALPTQVNDRVFNLEGRVEFGGCLRCVQVCEDDTHKVVEIQNTVFKHPEEFEVATTEECKTVGDMIIELRKNRNVQGKQFGNISSFNFTKTAFYDKIWDAQTTKARGLYINVPKQRVVARAYDKFFNINERPETQFDALQDKPTFPVTAYVKENGFLGIVSYNEENESLFVTTKSNPDGDFAVWLNEILQKSVSAENLEAMKQYAKEHNVSFVFECVDMARDPHIIDYQHDSLYLLDIVYNDMHYRKYSFEQLCEVADNFGLVHKERAYILENWQEFFDWYYLVLDEDYKYNGRVIEGFVIEDADGYMVKLKLAYYNFWKFMRSIAREAIHKGYIDGKRTSALTTPIANQFYGWVKTLHNSEDLEAVPRDICTLRRMFLETDAGKKFVE